MCGVQPLAWMDYTADRAIAQRGSIYSLCDDPAYITAMTAALHRWERAVMLAPDEEDH